MALKNKRQGSTIYTRVVWTGSAHSPDAVYSSSTSPIHIEDVFMWLRRENGGGHVILT